MDVLETRSTLQSSGCIQQDWIHLFRYAFPPTAVYLGGRGINAGLAGQGSYDSCSSHLTNLTIVRKPAKNEYKDPFTSTKLTRITKDPQGELPSLISARKLRLVVRLVSGKQ